MKVLLIDDHPLILSALQSVIGGLVDDLTMVSAASAEAARELLARDPEIDLVLLDLHLGDADGFDLLGEFRAAHPALPVVVLSASDRHADVMRALDLGAMGFVPKRASTTMLADALRRVLAGEIYMPPQTLRSVAPPAATAQAPVDASALRSLTPRQREVMTLLMEGKSNKLIARALGLSVETVKDHVASLLRTLDVSTRTQAVLAIGQLGQAPARAAGEAPRPASH